jgi:hydroxyethylthiazole kinase
MDAYTRESLLQPALDAIIRLRRHGALVHCLTNTVAQNFTANVLLACGATPSMTTSPREVTDFTARADVVLVNLGTLDEERMKAILASLEVCNGSDKPFVLDPVMCHVSPLRLRLAEQILKSGPAIMRANKNELAALDGASEHFEGCIALTGQTDRLVIKGQELQVHNGDLMMAKVTAIGCAQGALMAALLATGADGLTAALAALIWFGVAGESAATRSSGPGSFSPAFIDALYGLSIDHISKRAKLS